MQKNPDDPRLPGTPLSFGEPSSEEGVKYKEHALPPGEIESLKASDLIGLSADAPTAEPRGPSQSGALKGGTGGGSANTQVILPKHRGAVERFFKRP